MLKRLKRLSKRNKIILAAVIVLLVGGGLYLWLTRNGEDVVTQITDPDKKYYSQLTGKEVEKDVSEQPILGIMIENSEEARPQTGLDAAGIVFETVTEGGITRYLALYQEDMPVEVGPVRSVRPAFVNWLMGFDASVAHVGGSQEALDLIEQREAKSLNQFYNEGPYYRSSEREAPHNVYARTKDLVALQRELDHKTAEFDEIPRSEDSPSAAADAKAILLQFSHPVFGARFDYDPASNSYVRSLAGVPHLDAATGKPITVKNVIVIRMTGEVNALSSGKGRLFKDGTAQDISWKQADFEGRIVLTDAEGNEVALNRGDSWFAVLPGSGSVTVQ